jgi:hypothetical protein
MGIKSAPMFITDPEGYARMKAARERRADSIKKAHDRKTERVYGGTQ